MTTYEPYPSVVINGSTTIPSSTLSDIRISYGRRDVLEQPAPGLANINFWTTGDAPLDIELSDKIEVKIDKGTSGTATIFTGIVSDVQIGFDAYGSTSSVARYSVTAVGPLAQLNKRLARSTYAEEKDGTRVYNIVYDAFTTTWDDILGATSWADAPGGISWTDYDSYVAGIVAGLSNIDTPGQFTLVAYSSGITNALSLAQSAANSGRGVLYDLPNGTIGYDDYAARATNSPFTLTTGDVLAPGLSVDAKWGEIYNYISVDYASGSAYDENVTSQQLYGNLVGDKSTTLKNLVDAQQQATDYIKSRAFARVYPEQIVIPLHSETVSDATRDQMTLVYNGLYIKCTTLPLVMGGQLESFVEGWEWSLTRYTADLTLYLSQYSETYSSQIWLQVPQTTDWATYNNTVKWQDA